MFQCKNCQTNFEITDADREFYNKIKQTGGRKLYPRQCDKCDREIRTVYTADKAEKVYCEECYRAEIY